MRRPPEKPRSRRKPGRRTSVADAGSTTAAARRAPRGEFAPEMPAGTAPQRQPKPPSASVAPKVGRTKVAKRSRSDDPPPEKTEIGFKKPPKAHSWKKGESGNPKGRKKGSRNKKTIIISLMEGRLGRKIPDPKKLTAQEALLWKAIQKGLAGDARAMAFAFKRYDDATASGWAGPVITTEEDRQVYDALRTKIRREIEEENDASE
jgi:Family of unknown function (DUF5681)